ncbi:MAG: methyltransferase GidB [Cyanobacteria bacterium RYN_339]|nr:methyltransferase GidB [Cyanobacteria bacterium RYN_339]
MSDIWPWFQQAAAELGVPVTDAQRDAFARYHELLVEANKVTNLTRIVDDRDAAVKHYLDSMLFLGQLPAELHERPLKLVDVGAGAGIPGIPLLIMRPHWHGLLVDSVGKKVQFMNEALEALGLSNSRALHGRAEELAREPGHRDGYDLGVARAVAALPELLELCLPFVKPGGILLVSKGAKGAEELASAGPALKALHGRLRSQAHLALPDGAGERNLYVIDKHDRTPAGYPRKPGIPHRKPLC